MPYVSIEGRVYQGAEMLDKFFPGWASHVNIDTLEITDSRRCVLGQCASVLQDLATRQANYFLHDNNYYGVKELFRHLDVVDPGGFFFMDYGFTMRVEDDVHVLNSAWRDAIKRRQND